MIGNSESDAVLDRLTYLYVLFSFDRSLTLTQKRTVTRWMNSLLRVWSRPSNHKHKTSTPLTSTSVLFIDLWTTFMLFVIRVTKVAPEKELLSGFVAHHQQISTLWKTLQKNYHPPSYIQFLCCFCHHHHHHHHCCHHHHRCHPLP